MTQPTGSRFFSHLPPASVPETVVLSEGTRYLCAAAYLLPGFPARVISELSDNEHRAVAPTVGFDLGPVLLHCHRALVLTRTRDTLLTLILLIGLLITPYTWILLVVGAGAAMISRTRPAPGRAGQVRVAAIGLLVLLAGILVTGGLGYLTGGQTLGGSGIDAGSPLGHSPDSGDNNFLQIVLLSILAIAVYTGWRVRVYRTILNELASGVPHRLPTPPFGRLRASLRRITAAQWGNIALQADRDPFLGAGEITHSWSMSLDLRQPDGTSATIDPVELQTHLREQLRAMHGGDLAEQERVPSLIVLDHIVAAGERRLPDPLIDPDNRVPYAQASPEAIDAIIRHPQGSLRYYLRAVVGAEGRDVRVGDELVTTAQDQEIAVSAFVYVAVEGGLLYLEFLAAVLPPVHDSLHVIDRLDPARLARLALTDAARYVLLTFGAAPFTLVSTLSTLLLQGRRQARADRESLEYRTYDYGARISVRDLVSGQRPQTHLQQLDAEKYYKLVERRITGAVLDFLRERGVDTSEYQARAMTILNQGVMISGGQVTGPIAAGRHASATAFNRATGSAPTSAPPPTKS